MTINKAFMKKYRALDRPEYFISVPVNRRLNKADFTKSRCNVHFAYEKGNIDDAISHGLLQKAVQEIPELSRFALYDGASSYNDIRQVVKDFDERKKQFGNKTKVLPSSNDYPH